MKIGNRLFESAPLSTLRFARRIICPVGQRPASFAISRLPDEATVRSILNDTHVNRTIASQRLTAIYDRLLGRFPAIIESMKQQSNASAEHFKRTDPDAAYLGPALHHYRSKGDHILLHAIACGYKTLPEFLQATMPDRYSTDEEVTEWCKGFLSIHDNDYVDDDIDSDDEGLTYTPDDVVNRFEEEDGLQAEARAMNKFLTSNPLMTDAFVLKGISEIRNESDEEMNTHVDGRDYIRAFLSNQPIMYDGFLSTTFEPEVARSFAGGNPATHPLYAIDFKDKSGRSEVLRRHALSDLSSDANREQTSSIMLAIRPRQSRGALVDNSWAEGLGDESELLLGSGHILMPSMAIRCNKGYVLVADAVQRGLMQ